jgi:hypothetical protein
MCSCTTNSPANHRLVFTSIVGLGALDCVLGLVHCRRPLAHHYRGQTTEQRGPTYMGPWRRLNRCPCWPCLPAETHTREASVCHPWP